MTYQDFFKIASSPWIDIYGIMQLASCGKSNASKIRNEIEQQIIKSGKRLPTSNKKYIPTRLVLEYLGFDENYIFKMASLCP